MYIGFLMFHGVTRLSIHVQLKDVICSFCNVPNVVIPCFVMFYVYRLVLVVGFVVFLVLFCHVLCLQASISCLLHTVFRFVLLCYTFKDYVLYCFQVCFVVLYVKRLRFVLFSGLFCRVLCLKTSISCPLHTVFRFVVSCFSFVRQCLLLFAYGVY